MSLAGASLPHAVPGFTGEVTPGRKALHDSDLALVRTIIEREEQSGEPSHWRHSLGYLLGGDGNRIMCSTYRRYAEEDLRSGKRARVIMASPAFVY